MKGQLSSGGRGEFPPALITNTSPFQKRSGHMEDSNLKDEHAVGEQSRQNADEPGGANGQRYRLTITDTEHAGSPITVWIEVMDAAIVGLGATDEKNRSYDVSFLLQRAGGQPFKKAEAELHENGGGDGDDDDDDDDDGNGDQCTKCAVQS